MKLQKTKNHKLLFIKLFLPMVSFFVVGNEVSGKTLLEQQLGTESIEEFVYYHEYPGKTNSVPTTYYAGAKSDTSFVLVRSKQKLNEIPIALTTNTHVSIGLKENNNYWVVNAAGDMYDRKIWKNIGIPEEEVNEVRTEVEQRAQTLRSQLLNLGLEHSPNDLNAEHGQYTNIEKQVLVTYSTTKNSNGLISHIEALSIDLEQLNPNVKWLIDLEYSNGGKAPAVINRTAVMHKGERVPIDRFVIKKVVGTDRELPKEWFARPAFEENKAAFFTSMTYYYSTNRFYGYDKKSNLVVRLTPDDPRLLKKTDKQKLVKAYWISAASIALFAAGCFAWAKYKKTK